jgi:lipopolysaccharide transport system ATP-binding protein
MGDTAIRIAGLGKRYRIGVARPGTDGLRQVVEAGVRRFARRLIGRTDPRPALEDFWALRDVSFEVRRGECVGVIGRNGAGKSTLLKVLSRITDPTFGEVGLRGRVGSLLEVGTGFHPELTGRENIFLNGAVLGMGRREIAQKFDEIVAFSEVEKFLETPVKRYSSGMYTRLAFAVAAHLEPEILIVDEVLAVGDTQFQQKCLGKMGEVTRGGRTVLFVSHNMSAVRALCTSCCVLEGGRLVYRGDVATGIKEYLRDGTEEHGRAFQRFTCSAMTSPRMLTAALAVNGQPASKLRLGDALQLTVTFAASEPLRSPKLGFVISDDQNRPLFNINNRYQPGGDLPTPAAAGTIDCDLGVLPLAAGRYHVSLWLGETASDTHIEMDALTFEVIDHDLWKTGRMPPGNFAPLWWTTAFTATGAVPESLAGATA